MHNTPPYWWREAAIRLSLQSLSGFLVWAATPGLGGHVALAGIAFVPLFLSLLPLRGWAALAWGLVGGLIYIIPGKWTTFANAAATHSHGAIPDSLLVLAFFLTYAIPFGLFTVVCGALQHQFPSSNRLLRILLPWLGGFGLAGLILITPTIFPFTPAVLISNTPGLIQLADIGGEPLLLGLLLTVNFGIALGLYCRCAMLRSSLLAIMLPLALAMLYATWSPHARLAKEQTSVFAAGLQTRWPVGSGNRIVLRDKRGTTPKSAIELTRASLHENSACRFVIWPEIPSLHERDLSCDKAEQLAIETNSNILTTCHQREDDQRTLPARLYTPVGMAGEHRKSRLIPGYERDMWSGEAELQPGNGPTLLQTKEIPPFVPSICYEIHFRNDLRRMALNGAQWFVQMANFNLFRSPMISEWDLAMARLRAVENRRAIVRSVNSGQAGLVLPNGRWQSALPPQAISAECHRVPTKKVKTLYSHWGDGVFWVLLFILASTAMCSRASTQTRTSLKS